MPSSKSGAEIVVDTLIEAGIRHVFGIVSIHNMPIVDAISRSDDIEMITARHEGSAAHMADGYARATNNLGVVLGSTGPGTTNLMTGLYEADFASFLLLILPYEADLNAILLFILLYVTDSYAILLFILLYVTDSYAILLFILLYVADSYAILLFILL